MRRAVILAAILATAGPALSCYATHEYRESRAAAPRPDPPPAVLPVRVAMVAGELRLGAAPGDLLYDLRVRLCRSHFAVRMPAAGGAPSVDVGLRRRPGEGPAVAIDEERNSIDLGLGAQVPADIRLDLGAGRHRASLGGLRLAGLRIDGGSGDLDIDFATPLLESPATMSVAGGTGRVALRGLGNASPGTLAVHGGSGPVTIDLGGAWTRDAAITIDAPLGDVLVEVPAGLGVVIATEGRDADDLALRGFARDEEGRWISPGLDAAARRVILHVMPGIGRFEARLAAPGASSASSLLAPRRSDITPTL